MQPIPDPEVLYLHAKASFDDDHKQSLGGMNVQLYLEWLQSRDPIESLSDEFVMAGRVATILRGLAYAVKHKPSVAKLWAPLARKLLADYDRLQALRAKEQLSS